MKIWEKCAVAGLLAVVAGCGGTAPGSSEESSQHREALAGTVATLSFATPRGTAQNQAFLSGSNSLIVDDRVTLAQAGQLPTISGLAAGGVQLGSNLVGHVNVFSAGPTQLRSNLHVFGSVKSVGAITVQNPVAVDGGRTSGVSVVPTVTSFNVTFPSAKSGDKIIGPDGPVVTVAPGAYGAFNLRTRGKALLRAGNYFFDSFSSEPGAQLQVDPTGGTAFIYVHDSFSYKTAISSSSSQPTKVVIGYVGSSLAYLQAGFSGAFIAPNATLELHRPDVGQYTGAFFARDLHVFSDSLVGFAPFDTSFICPLGDKDGDGVLDCTDLCFKDPLKTDPGICDCGVADTDTDLDGVPNCADECPNDPLLQHKGECGCGDHPAPVGTPCDDGVCRGVSTCNGSGQCGNPTSCAPANGCVSKFFNRKYYWICPGPVTWAQAETACRAGQTSLVEVESSEENAFLAKNSGSTSRWIGANDQAQSGDWHWATVTSASGDKFWSGDASGQSYYASYANWSGGSPLASTGNCGQLTSSGTWGSPSCTATAGFVCEVPTERLVGERKTPKTTAQVLAFLRARLTSRIAVARVAAAELPACPKRKPSAPAEPLKCSLLSKRAMTLARPARRVAQRASPRAPARPRPRPRTLLAPHSTAPKRPRAR